MECNKDEAIRAKEIAEKKMGNNDFEGAQKMALKAQNLYPELDNITQMLSICDVHCSAQKRLLGSEKDWYGVLQVEKLSDEQAIKKQYRRLALVLHPDKNRFPGAEGAFKLICEANALLSDPAKKSLYDNKIRVLSRSASVNPPNHYINRNSQPNKQDSTQNNTSNGFGSMNQHQVAPPASSARLEVFWTCCPYCKVRYQYLRQYINRSLQCPTCRKSFTAHEVSAQGVPHGSKMGQQVPQHMPPKSVQRQPAGFQEKLVPNPAKFKMGAQGAKGPSASHTESQKTASQKTIPPKPGFRTGYGSEGVKVASASGKLKTEDTDNRNASSVHGGNEGMTSDNDAIHRGRTYVRNKNWKRGKKQVEESSDSSNAQVEDLTTEENALKSESSGAQRSSLKRQHVSYQEAVEDHARSFKRAQLTKEDKRKEQNDAVDSKVPDSKVPNHGNKKSAPIAIDDSNSGDKEMGTAHSKESSKDKNADSDKDGKMRGVTGGKSRAVQDTVKIEIDSDGNTSFSTESDTDLLQCPDAEFSDFDLVRDERYFEANQFWACYDTLDSMPRFYAKVKKVCTSPFELHITWLEAVPLDKTYEEWVDEELPVGCGSFKLGTTEKTSLRLSFSHQVHCEKGKKRGSLTIYPTEGEVWALFKDWDKSWSSDPDNHKQFKYEIVEVLSNFVPDIGTKVAYLDKITGYVSLFQRASQSETNSFVIGPDELYKFSHCIPYFRMTGPEKEGVPIGSFELDPACLPLNLDDLYYPSKAETGCRYMDQGVNGSLPKDAEREGKSVASEGTNTPKEFLDLEEIKDEMSRFRRSPRGMNVSRQKH